MQRRWADSTCPFYPYNIVKYASNGRFGKKYNFTSRSRGGGWRFVPKEGNRELKKPNTPMPIMEISPMSAVLLEADNKKRKSLASGESSGMHLVPPAKHPCI